MLLCLNERGGDLLVQKGKRIHLFWCQNVPCLWRANPSFRSSVIGSGNIACAQISYRIVDILDF